MQHPFASPTKEVNVETDSQIQASGRQARGKEYRRLSGRWRGAGTPLIDTGRTRLIESGPRRGIELKIEVSFPHGQFVLGGRLERRKEM